MEQDTNKHSLFTFNSNNTGIFIFKVILMVTLFATYINHVLPQYNNSYSASLIDRVNRLESIDEPKIVLLGNSNLSFGIDSKLIEKNMNMPVVNMGFHGGCGNAFHERMGKLNVVPGDIYVLCHTDYNDDNQIVTPRAVWCSLENNYRLWKLVRLSDAETMLRSFPSYLKKCLFLYSSESGNSDSGDVYSRNAFDEYGDINLERKENRFSFVDGVTPPQIGDLTVKRINDLNMFLKKRGATLLVAGYPIGRGEFTVDRGEFVIFQTELTERLDCPVISNYADYMYDYKYFYDTELHLNSDGTELRTRQLIHDLKRWKETGENADPNDVRSCVLVSGQKETDS